MRLGWGPSGPEDGPPGRRVAVTGIGVVANAGIGPDAFWSGLCRPPASDERERRVTDFDPTGWFASKELRRIDRSAQFAVAAAEMAVEDAGTLDPDPARAGVVMGTGVGGLATLEAQVLVHRDRGPDRVSPFLIPMMMANSGAGAISIRRGWRGPCETTVTACAAGTHAIGNAARLVASGRCQVVIAGGAEAAITPLGVAGFANMTALSPSGVSRPFDQDRDGFVLGEGSGAMVLEDWDRAVARGARIYAEVAGAGSTADAYHITAPQPDGSGAVACMELALADAGLGPQVVGHINAHGTSTGLNDASEAEAINKVFGTPGPPVTSIKGVTGHSLGAAGAVEAVAVVLTIDRRQLPPTAGTTSLDPAITLDVVTREARTWTPGPVLSNSFGFGGHNGALVIVPPGD
ncbi:MAG TPA: beta-ketoacyl-[acyl-carrier-protein] synthase family protein [Acidimicrobiales bacterium]|jgi:3-oxoacyl-[acyl-carrier-protein] synthase II|nr:beta-ketoacyl-[acyl-carrier-protein] synthase family protein [Acidimicrobiales bacterium]